VIGHPLAERPRRSEDVRHRRGDVRRPSHRRGPRVEQHVHDRARPSSRRLAAVIDGRMIVDSSPAAAISRSISACSTAIGFGCWKNECGVWCGDDRNTTRRARAARRSTTAGALAGGTVQTRKTAPTSRSAASSDPGTSFPTLTGGLMALMMTLCPSCQRGAGGLGVRATVNPGARVPPGAGDAP
jgi:hypothetical protein